MVAPSLGRVDARIRCHFPLPRQNLSQLAKLANKRSTYVKRNRFRISQTQATDLYEDNLACVAMSENLVRQKFSRHIDIRKFYVRELVLAAFLELVPLRTHKIVADALTKSLTSTAFVGHRQIMTGYASVTTRLPRCVGG